MHHRKQMVQALAAGWILAWGVSFSSVTAGKYAGEFLAVGVGAKYLAMGGSAAAFVDDVTAMYWNPAGLAALSVTQVQVMHAERFAGIVNWDFAGVGVPLKSGRTLGVGFFRLGVDGVPLTKLQNESHSLGEVYYTASGQPMRNEPYAYKYIDPNDAALYVSYAVRRDSGIRVGGNVKIIRRSAGDYTAWGVGFDAGAMIRMRSWLHLGAMVQDITSTMLAWSNGTKELILPQIRLGFVSPFRIRRFGIGVASDVRIDFEGRSDAAQASLGRAGLDFFSGLELTYAERIGIRTGIDRGAFTIGTGFRIASIYLDYGFLSHTDLGGTHRISVTLNDTKNLLNLNP